MKFHEFANIFPLINGDVFDDLIADIAANGLNHPITLLDDGILDGRNRYRACIAAGVTPDFVDFNGDDPLSFVLSENLKRRHLTASQRAVCALECLPYLEKQAKERQGTRTDIDNIKAKLPESNGQSRDHAARQFNVGGRYVSDVKKIAEESPELIEKIKAGDISIQKAKSEVKSKEITEIQERRIADPDGLYDVIVIDPPWEMEKIVRDVAPNQVAFDYPTMSEKELQQLAIPAAEHCHVFTWTTHKHLPMALRLFDYWDVKYVLTMVWHKPGGFQPFGLPQYNCEFCLYGRIGTPEFVDTKAFNVCFDAPRGKHSEKPEEFYELLRRVTSGTRLDMFNRRRIGGFTGWGNESDD